MTQRCCQAGPQPAPPGALPAPRHPRGQARRLRSLGPPRALAGLGRRAACAGRPLRVLRAAAGPEVPGLWPPRRVLCRRRAWGSASRPAAPTLPPPCQPQADAPRATPSVPPPPPLCSRVPSAPGCGVQVLRGPVFCRVDMFMPSDPMALFRKFILRKQLKRMYDYTV